MGGSYVFAAFVILAVVFYLRDIGAFGSDKTVSTSPEESNSVESPIPLSGMQRYFLDVKRFIESDPRYTVFWGNIHGGNYPPSAQAKLIATATNYLWFAGLAGVFGGEALFSALKIREPEWFVYVKNNKMSTLAGLFVVNSIGHNMLSTGAFEIYVNDQLVYSKLAVKKLPDAHDIVAALASAGYK